MASVDPVWRMGCSCWVVCFFTHSNQWPINNPCLNLPNRMHHPPPQCASHWPSVEKGCSNTCCLCLGAASAVACECPQCAGIRLSPSSPVSHTEHCSHSTSVRLCLVYFCPPSLLLPHQLEEGSAFLPPFTDVTVSQVLSAQMRFDSLISLFIS